jgi:hypothetical protein
MYLTSAELLKHMLGQHGVTCWVCDHCSSNSETDQSFVFESQQNWEIHMKAAHLASFPVSQLSSLAKVSQRVMLDQLTCPLCGYVTPHPQSILDDHIAKHIHEFALRCLPWGTGHIDDDSVNAKSAGMSNSSQETDNGDDEELGQKFFTLVTPKQIIKHLVPFNTTGDRSRYSLELVPQAIVEQLLVVQNRLGDFLGTQEYSTMLRLRSEVMINASKSLARPLADLLDPTRSKSAQEQTRMSGRLPHYLHQLFPIFNSRDVIFETLDTHLAKILVALQGVDLKNADIKQYAVDTGHHVGVILKEELVEVEAALQELSEGGRSEGEEALPASQCAHLTNLSTNLSRSVCDE